MAIYQGHNEDSSGNLLLSIGNGMTATVETGSTASQVYTKGAYLFFNNRLCKAASAIAKGATLTIGSNLTQTSLGAEITSHLRSSDGKEFYFDVKNGQYGYYPSASKTASEFVPFGGTSLNVVLNIANNNTMTHTLTRDTDTIYLFSGVDLSGDGYVTKLLSYDGVYQSAAERGGSNLGRGNLGYAKFTGTFQKGKNVVFCGMGNLDIANDNRSGSILVY